MRGIREGDARIGATMDMWTIVANVIENLSQCREDPGRRVHESAVARAY